jgi:hypothetical protein
MQVEIFELIDIEFQPIEDRAKGYWVLMENEYHSRQSTVAESLPGCSLLLRDRYGLYIPLNQEQRKLLKINLENY